MKEGKRCLKGHIMGIIIWQINFSRRSWVPRVANSNLLENHMELFMSSHWHYSKLECARKTTGTRLLSITTGFIKWKKRRRKIRSLKTKRISGKCWPSNCRINKIIEIPSCEKTRRSLMRLIG